MYVIEIRGTQYQYRNLRHLHQQLTRRMAALNKQEATHKQGLLEARAEKRMIARVLGGNVRNVEDRSLPQAAGAAAH